MGHSSIVSKTSAYQTYGTAEGCQLIPLEACSVSKNAQSLSNQKYLSSQIVKQLDSLQATSIREPCLSDSKINFDLDKYKTESQFQASSQKNERQTTLYELGSDFKHYETDGYP